MATLYVAAKVNGTDYGALASCGFSGMVNEAVSFGAVFASASHFDIRDITVGTTGYGDSSLFAPPLTSYADFDGIAGGSDLVIAGGVLSVDDDSTNDHFGWKMLAGNPPTIYVQFQLRVRTGDSFPDYHDIWLDTPDSPTDNNQEDGIGTNLGSHWYYDGCGPRFGFGATGAPTWDTVGLYWSTEGPYTPPPPTPKLRFSN